MVEFGNRILFLLVDWCAIRIWRRDCRRILLRCQHCINTNLYLKLKLKSIWSFKSILCYARCTNFWMHRQNEFRGFGRLPVHGFMLTVEESEIHICSNI